MKKEYGAKMWRKRDKAIRNILIKIVNNKDFYEKLKEMDNPLELCELMKYKSWWFLAFHFKGVYALEFIKLAKEDVVTLEVRQLFIRVDTAMVEVAKANGHPPGKLDNDTEE